MQGASTGIVGVVTGRSVVVGGGANRDSQSAEELSFDDEVSTDDELCTLIMCELCLDRRLLISKVLQLALLRRGAKKEVGSLDFLFGVGVSK